MFDDSIKRIHSYQYFLAYYVNEQPFCRLWETVEGKPRRKQTRPALRTKEGRLAHTQKTHTQKTHTRKRCTHTKDMADSLIIWLKLADTIDQIPDCCLVFFCVIDYPNIFDRRFFYSLLLNCLYIYIYIEPKWHAYFIVKAQLGWGWRICRVHLCGGVRLPPLTSVLIMTQNNLMVRLWSKNSGECEVPLHCC